MSVKERREQRIREAAYSRWEETGRPEGGADEFWLAAEKLDGPSAEGETDGEAGVAAADPRGIRSECAP